MHVMKGDKKLTIDLDWPDFNSNLLSSSSFTLCLYFIANTTSGYHHSHTSLQTLLLLITILILIPEVVSAYEGPF